MLIRITFVLLVATSGVIRAQEKPTYAVRLNTTGFWVDQTFRAVATPQLVRTHGRHAVGLGPALLLTSVGVATRPKPKLVGLQGSYRFYPTDPDRWLTFFLYSETNLQRLRDRWTSVRWNSSIQSYVAYVYQRTEWLVQTTLGYGLSLHVSPRIILTQSVGLGAYWSATDGDVVSAQAPERADEDLSGYPGSGLSYGVSLGVSYRWNK